MEWVISIFSEDGTTVVFGSWLRFVDASKGSVIVYDYDSDSKEWMQRCDIIVGEEDDTKDYSVLISDHDTWVAIGSPANENYVGVASVYEYSIEDGIVPKIFGIEETFGWVFLFRRTVID